MKLKDLLSGVTVLEYGVSEDTEIIQLSSDSRSILCGGLFICVEGSCRNGHDYIGDALSKGAAAVVASDREKIPAGTPYALVENTRLAEAYIWSNWYGNPSRGMKTVAVTGTNGKTSTVFMIREILKAAGEKVGIITTVRAMAGEEILGTFGGSSVTDAASAMTTPDPEFLYGTIRMMKEKAVTALVFEASSHALSQYKTDPMAIDTAVFTNLSEEHLDYHGTMENYFKSKLRLAESADTLVINSDDSYMRRIKDMYSARKTVIACSADAKSPEHLTADVSALRQKEISLDGCEYIYFSRDAVFCLTCPVPGEFTVQNTLLAATAAMTISARAENVKDALANLKRIDGRLEEVDLSEFGVKFKVFIDYAHTPAALESLLMSVRKLRRRGQRICVLFGCGGNRDRSKRRKMGAIASRLADFVIVTSDNSRKEDTGEIIAEIVSGLDLEKSHAVIKDRREAITYAVTEARDDDILILAGKGHEKYEIDSEGKKPFDEAAIVRDAVIKYKVNKNREQ